MGKGISLGWFKFVTGSCWPPFLGWDGEPQNPASYGSPVCVGIKGQEQKGGEMRIILERSAFYMYIYSVIRASLVVHQWSIHLQCRRIYTIESRSQGREDLPEKEMATHSTVPAWEVSWTESLVGYSPKSRRVRHDWVTKHPPPSCYN